MKTFINILIIVLSSYTISWSHQLVNAEDLEYSVSSQNIDYQGENTFIFLKISNNSNEKSEIPGYLYYLQRFGHLMTKVKSSVIQAMSKNSQK